MLKQKDRRFNPYPHNLFVVKPKVKDINSEFAKKFKHYIEKIPLLIQDVNLPDFDISNQPFIVRTQNGQYKSVGNNIVNAQGQLQLKFLDTEDSIIQGFFYPWLNIIAYAGVYDDLYSGMCTGDDWPYPRMDFEINFYLDQVISNPELTVSGQYTKQMPSTFSYIFQGCFPSNTESKNVKHSVPSPGQYIRGVTFQYNNAICISNSALNNFYGTNIQTLDLDKYKNILNRQQKQSIVDNKVVPHLVEQSKSSSVDTHKQPKQIVSTKVTGYSSTIYSGRINETITYSDGTTEERTRTGGDTFYQVAFYKRVNRYKEVDIRRWKESTGVELNKK